MLDFLADPEKYGLVNRSFNLVAGSLRNHKSLAF